MIDALLTTDTTCEDEILSLSPGDHLCLLYDEDPAEQMSVLLPFVGQGLAAAERVIYIAEDTAPESLRSALHDYGIDPESAEANGAFVIWTKKQWRQPGPLNPGAMAAQMRRAVDAAVWDGYPAVRFAIEMTWTLGPSLDSTDLRRLESMVNEALAGAPVRIICQYNRSRLSDEMIETSLLTHPIAVLDKQVCPNAFYQPFDAATQLPAVGNEVPARVEWMVSQLRWVRRFEQERQHRADAERSAAHAEAERTRVQDLYDIANQTADSLAQANALKDEFLSLVSHELRTPLTVVLGNSDLLLRAEEALAPEERVQALEDIRREAHRMSRLVTNLLSVARLNIDTSRHLKPVMLAPLLERVTAQHHRSYPNREIRLSFHEGEGPCIGIEALIEQVLVNLVSNAEKYSSEDLPIEVGVRDGHGWRIVTVKDYGIGLNPNEINRAFEAFYRSEKLPGLNAGLGIGLTVCKRLVEAQGGRIWARSREGGGAEFCFMLRQAKEEVGAAG